MIRRGQCFGAVDAFGVVDVSVRSMLWHGSCFGMVDASGRSKLFLLGPIIEQRACQMRSWAQLLKNGII